MKMHLLLSTLFFLVAGTPFAHAGNSGIVQPDFSELQLKNGMKAIVGGSEVIATDPIATTTVLIVGFTTKKDENGQDQEGQYICTGSILDTDLILTAAHCLSTATSRLRAVFIRDINVPDLKIDPSQVLRISAAIPHPSYVPTPEGEPVSGANLHDIALLRLRGSIPAGYQAAELLPDDEELSVNQNTILAGYGITNASTQEGSGTLRRVSTKILGAASDTEVAVDMSKRKGMCSGDSGGPAYVQSGNKLLLWGVTSRSDMTCSRFGIYTAISAYTDWIAKTAVQLQTP